MSNLVPIWPSEEELEFERKIILKCCPFCGKNPVLLAEQNSKTNNYVYRVCCTDFQCMGMTSCCQASKEAARDGAIKSWQNRIKE